MKTQKKISDVWDFGEKVEFYEIPYGVDSLISAYITKTKNGIYKGWFNGCGIGGASRNIEKTKKHVRDYVVDSMSHKLHEYEVAMANTSASFEVLRNTADLDRFITDGM